VRLPPIELARLTNAKARMFVVYQSGCLTLQVNVGLSRRCDVWDEAFQLLETIVMGTISGTGIDDAPKSGTADR
jgi:hypothetical protein